ncbi:MAG: ABC transporter permease [Bacteroidales bacterium]|nr:ABC transporter permease [Bacteroidales bacterium]
MYKIFILALREFRTSVRTKSFVIGLVVTPVFMFGSLFVMEFFKNSGDISDKIICVIDHTGQIVSTISEAAEWHNQNEIFDTVKNKQIKPRYIIEVVMPDTANLLAQKTVLSDRVRNKQIHAFVEIGPDAIHPKADYEKTRVKYYSENSLMDDIRAWLNWPVNNKIRQLRVEALGLEDKNLQILFSQVEVAGMGLVTGEPQVNGKAEAKESTPVEAILIPYIFVLLMFMMVLMSAVPLLNSVMEEKTDRIAEVLLGTVTPFQFMMGKVLGGISISLTGSLIYVVGGTFIAAKLNYSHLIPYHLLPWFFVYMLLSVLMIGSIMASLGSACNDSKDAQSLQFPAMLPVILPIFFMMPVLKDPLSSLSVGLSLFPPFTPFIMLVRQASPVSIPLWQPIAGMAGVVLFTMLVVWAGGKIFRTFILVQGKKPSLGMLIKYVFTKS